MSVPAQLRYLVLEFLAGTDTADSAELLRAVGGGTTESALHAAVDHLHREGLVEVAKYSPDRWPRYDMIRITAPGRQALQDRP